MNVSVTDIQAVAGVEEIGPLHAKALKSKNKAAVSDGDEKVQQVIE